MTTTPGLWRPGFILNTTLTGQQFEGVVAPTNNNQFFAAWVSDANVAGQTDIIVRSFNSFGNALTGEVNLTTLFGFPTDQPDAVQLPIAGQGNGLAVTFTFELPGDPDIYVVRTNSALTPLENFIPINTSFSPTDHPSITSFANGSLMVAYTFHNSATDWDIVANTVSSAGVVSAVIPIFNDTDRSDNSDLATLANGNVVVVFQNEFAANPADNDIIFTIKTATGANVVSPTFVTGGANTPGNEVTPKVAALADGGFVVTWVDSLGDQNGTSQGIRAAVYDANGVLVQGDILVNVFNQAGLQLQPDVTALPDGGFVVAWEDVGPVLVDRAQRFDEAGNLVGTPVVFSPNATFDIDAATFSDGRSIFTINDFFTNPGNNDVVSSIWDTRITDANQATGANFFGPGGGSADLLIVASHNTIRTAQALQIENGTLLTSKVIAIVGSNVNFDGSGDFNNDGLSDLLAHQDNPTTLVRSLFAYQMTPVGPAGTSTLANVGLDWVVDAFGDFNGSGTDDILIHRDAGGVRTFEVLSINNYAVQSAPIIQVTGIDWIADGTGDFNGNGTDDILEHRIVAGGNMNVQVVTMNNNAVQSVTLLANIGSDWQIDGTGDFNQDGTSDILMHRDSSNGVRTLEVLTIQNNAIQSATVIAQVGTNISVDGVGDFNSDGTSDIALHQDVGTTRTDLIYNVVNNTVVNPHTVAITGIDWHVS
jgi:hypothetical protein